MPLACSVLAWAALAVSARAADPPAQTGQERVVSVSVFTFYGPKYLGAERYGPYAFPAIELRRPGAAFALASPDDGLGIPVLDSTVLQAGPVAALRQGRNAGVDHRLTGLDRDPWTIEAGAFAAHWVLPDRLRVRAELRHGVRGHDGVALDLSADLFARLGALTASVGPRLGMTDAGLAQRQFGVGGLASQRNGLFAPYRADGGAQSVGLSSALTCDWSSAWRTTLYGRYDRLIGDAAASPITRRLGAADQFTAGLGVTYSFRSEQTILP